MSGATDAGRSRRRSRADDGRLTDAQWEWLHANTRLILERELGCKFAPADKRGWAQSLCPVHNEQNPSFGVSNDGACRCQGCEIKGDVIKVIAATTGCDKGEAIRRALTHMPGGWHPGTNGTAPSSASSTKDIDELVMPVPREAPPLPPINNEVARYVYRDQGGCPLLVTIRIEPGRKGTGKDVIPYTLRRGRSGKLLWRATLDGVTPRPIYGADRIKDHTVVLVVEGEKTADAAHALWGTIWPCVTTIGGAGQASVAHAFSCLAGRDVVIWPDHDDEGRRYAAVLALAIDAAGAASVSIVDVPQRLPAHWDLADLEPTSKRFDRAFTANDSEQLIRQAPSEKRTAPPVLRRDGKPAPVLANVLHELRAAPVWRGVLAYDEFAGITVTRKPPPWAHGSPCASTAWTDRDDSLTAEWLQKREVLVTTQIAGEAVETVARDTPFHPVREYLTALVWDGRVRLDDVLCRYWGAEDTTYNKSVGARWMISAVARIMKPGCKADCLIVFEGPQGIFKSQALAVLAGPYFTDRLSDLHSKDSAVELAGVWIVELSELDTMSRAESATIKAFMSRSHDRFRPPYGKRAVERPRQCVFAGTVNPEGGYLKDATGARRFWPVRCGRIDLEALKRDRDQLWAEARAHFTRGDPWWLETAELEAQAAVEQAARYQEDPWTAMIEQFAEGKETVAVDEVLSALNIPTGRWSKADTSRVTSCLVSMGYRRFRPRSKESRTRPRLFRRATE